MNPTKFLSLTASPARFSLTSTHRQRCKRLALSASQQTMEIVTVVFTSGSDTTTTSAQPGTNIYEVAEACGVQSITLGCCSGNCGICEVEVKKYMNGSDDTEAIIVRSCITAIPPGYDRIEINDLVDGAWGVDGYDT